VNIVHLGVGPISQFDVDMAQSCNACIVGFNIRSPPNPISLCAKQANIKV
jgi:translation initiation factor IF-2